MSLPLPADPVILLDPHPRRIDRTFDADTKRRLEQLGRVLWHDGSPAAAGPVGVRAGTGRRWLATSQRRKAVSPSNFE